MSIPNFSISRFLVTSLSILSLAAVIAIGVSRSTNLESATAIPITNEKGKQTAVFAGGCFWGVEAYFKIVNGVLKTTVGYAGGFTDFPGYKAVCSGKTGHTETVVIVYDSTITDLITLLEHFFFIIDPTELNKQGHDEGTQYRSAVFYYDIEDKEIIIDYIDSIRAEYQDDIVTETLPIMKFWEAEEYHQDYLEMNPGSYCHIDYTKFMCASKIDTLSYLKNKAKKMGISNLEKLNKIGN